MPEPVTLHHGDCLEVLAGLPADHFDAIVTDPPYHLTSIVRRFGAEGAAPAQPGTDGLFQRGSRGFMGQTWDGGDIAFRPETWAALWRVTKPGGHLVAFNHSRTWAHMAVAIEAAGWEMRDSILDIYAAGAAWAGFLDSLTPDQIKAQRRALAAADAPLLAWLYGCGFPKSHDVAKGIDKALGAEREVVGRRRTNKGDSGGQTYAALGEFSQSRFVDVTAPATPEAAAWQGWGTALKPAWEPIVLARKPLRESSIARQHLATGTGGLNIDAARVPASDAQLAAKFASVQNAGPRRNAVYGSDDRARAGAAPHNAGRWPANVVTDGSAEVLARFPVDAEGSVARFFYSAKAGAADRAGSDHPTVKPQALMRWLVRLVTARGGLVLDPFGGSGSTGWAAQAEGRRAVLIERDAKFAAHIAARIAGLGAPAPTDPASPVPPQPDLFG